MMIMITRLYNTLNFSPLQNHKFSAEKMTFFLILAQNPCKPQICYIKMGCKGYTSHGHFSMMGKRYKLNVHVP